MEPFFIFANPNFKVNSIPNDILYHLLIIHWVGLLSQIAPMIVNESYVYVKYVNDLVHLPLAAGKKLSDLY